MNDESLSTLPPSGYLRTADLIAALSIAADLALGLPVEHSARSCYIAIQIASELGLPPEQQGVVYYTALLLDAGCTAWASAFASYIDGDETAARKALLLYGDPQDPLEVFNWLRQYMATGSSLPIRAERILDFVIRGRELFREGFRNTCEVSNRFAQRLGMPHAVQQALLYVFERWDCKGMPDGIPGNSIPVAARVVHAAMYLELFHRRDGREAALRLASDRRAKAFDPRVIDAFLAATTRSAFWETLEQDGALDTIRSLEPSLPFRFIPEEKLADVALFAADFADLKTPYTAGHARRVASIAEQIARRMSLPGRDVADVRLAALLHDIGLVAIPAFVLNKPQASLTSIEWESLRLHPYHGERILSRVPELEKVAAIVGAHEEHVDGRGYYRGLTHEQIPLGARIIAVADAFDDLTHERPGQLALADESAIEQIREAIGHRFDPEVFAAFVGEDVPALQTRRKQTPRQNGPAGLTAREIEVLRLAAKGLTRKQMADVLVVSESTVRSHLEHVYDKIGVSTRAAATLFAVEQDLIA